MIRLDQDFLSLQCDVHQWMRADGNYYFWSLHSNRWRQCLPPPRVVELFDERLEALRAFRE